MLYDPTPITLKQITPQTLLQWDKETWLQLRQVLSPNPKHVITLDNYHFGMVITEKGTPKIQIESSTKVNYLDFKYNHGEVYVADVLTHVVDSSFDPTPLLEGIKATYDAFLKLHSDLLQFQIKANTLAKNSTKDFQNETH